MPSEVSYSPVQTATETLAPTPKVSLSVSGDTFGANVGAAQRGLGLSEEQAGNEIFQRAEAMQQLNNEAAARDAQTQNMKAQDTALSKFQTLQGPQASPDALSAFQKESEETRKSFRDQLASPDAQKLYDAQSISVLQQNNRSAALHSASELRGYAKTTQQALVDNTTAKALGNQSDQEFQSTIQSVHDQLVSQVRDSGFDENSPIGQDVMNKGLSKAYAYRIQSVARTDWQRAQKLLDDGMDKGLIRGDDIAASTKLIQSQTMVQGPKSVNQSINDGSSFALGRKQVDIEQARSSIQGIESGGNYLARGPVIKSGQYAGQQALGAYGVMPGNLQEWLQSAKMPAMSEDEFLHNPGAQDQLFEKRFTADMKKYGSANAAANVWFTGKPNPPANASDGITTAPDYLQKFNAGLAKVLPTSDKVAAGRDLAQSLNPALGATLADATQTQIENQAVRQARMAKDQEAQDIHKINSAIGGRDPGDPVPGSVAEFQSQHPDLGPIFDRNDGEFVGKVDKMLKAAQSHDDAITPARTDTANQLSGMALNDPSGFRSVDLSEKDLRASDRKKLLSTQGKILESGTSGDPTAVKRLQWIAPITDAAGLTGPGADKNERDKFTGALEDEVDTFKTQNGRAPNRPEYEKMARSLLNDITTKKGMFWDSKDKEYNLTPPPEEDAAIRQQFSKSNPNVPISQAMVNTLYRRHLYNLTLQGKSADAR